MKKIITISFVLFMAYIGLGLSVAQGNDDFVFENAQYMNFTGKDECIKSNRSIYNKVMLDNHAGKLYYVGGIYWQNDKFNVSVFTNEKVVNGRMDMVFFYNSLDACKNFNQNYDILVSHIGR